jgi:hypothetical protein
MVSNFIMPRASLILLTVACVTGCNSTPQTIALGVGATTAVGGLSPNNEIEQVYYLGAFDPREQVQPAVYRVRVRGQASFISLTRFASGWVPASLIDSLGTNVSLDKESGNIQITKANDTPLPTLINGRRMILFGPEGFREAPRDHRLVIVMGSSPEDFFKAIDSSLGVISQAQEKQRSDALEQPLFRALLAIKGERERLQDLRKDMEVDLPDRKEEKK